MSHLTVDLDFTYLSPYLLCHLNFIASFWRKKKKKTQQQQNNLMASKWQVINHQNMTSSATSGNICYSLLAHGILFTFLNIILFVIQRCITDINY